MEATPVETVTLGRTDVRVPRLGIGTWAWGDKAFWGYGVRYGPRDVVDAFGACVQAGATFFDTAEVYGHGESEKILGWMCRRSGTPTVVATKFGLLPGRDGARSLRTALTYSLRRLGLPRVDLYQIHWPDTSMATVASLMDALADVVAEGLVRAVGVSNYSAAELREAHAALARRGIPLATQQVEYSLVHRAPETDGVLDACTELGVSLLAYSPLGQGILAGTYHPGNVPDGPRKEKAMFEPDALRAARPVVDTLTQIGAAHGGHSPVQMALAWLMARPGVIPVVGVRNEQQAYDSLGVLQCSLTYEDLAVLDRVTQRWRGEGEGTR